MPRYSGWRRLSGETADRPDLLDLGKRLLGYLAEQRALSGNTTLSIERKTADGSIVRARFVGDLPQIEVMAARPAAENPPIDVGGFIITPHVHNTPLGEAALEEGILKLLDNKLSPRTRIFYKDADHLPDGAPSDAQWASYTPAFPDGVPLSGNVDWKNAKETIAVSWYGAGSRYFHDSTSDLGFEVFTHGQLLLSLRDLDIALFPDILNINSLRVHGAAVRTVPDLGVSLLVLAHGTTASTYQRLLIAVPITAATGATTPVMTCNLDDAALLWSGNLTPTQALEDVHYLHPWVFNASATEARTLIPTAYTGLTVREEVLDLSDLSAIAYSETLHTTTITNEQSATGQVADLLWRSGNVFDTVTGGNEGVPPSVVHGPQPQDNEAFDHRVSGVPILSKLDVVDVSYTNALPCAVDYKAAGGVVYAYMPPCQAGTYRGEIATDVSVRRKNHLITLYNVELQFESAVAYWWDENYEDENSYAYDQVATRASSFVSGRLELPWGVTLQVLNEETSSVSNSVAKNQILLSHAPGSNSDGGGGPEAGVDGAICSTSGSNNFASTVSVRRLAIWHLDLRNDVVVYSILEHSYVQSSAIDPYGFNVNLDHIPDFIAPDPADTAAIGTITGTYTTHRTGTLTTRVQVGTEIRAQAVASESIETNDASSADLSNWDVVWGGEIEAVGENPAAISLVIGSGQSLAQSKFDAPWGTLDYDTASPPTGESFAVDDATETVDTATSADFYSVGDFTIFFGDEFTADFGWMPELPLASIANPLQWGAWAVHRGVLCFSQPWPEGDFVTPGFKHMVGTRSLAEAAIAPNATSFAPIAVLPKVAGI